MKIWDNLYEVDSQLFRSINKYFDHPLLQRYFRIITHLGGATFTIAGVVLLMLFTRQEVQMTAIAAAISLAVSHLPVAIMKKIYPRRRPYFVLENTNVLDNPLKDHSFPSGHTTAIFSVTVPFILLSPLLCSALLFIGVSVGLSRIFLGLHYPSDVLVGMMLGSTTGLCSFLAIQQFVPHVL